jgi:hypothetical protein
VQIELLHVKNNKFRGSDAIANKTIFGIFEGRDGVIDLSSSQANIRIS